MKPPTKQIAIPIAIGIALSIAAWAAYEAPKKPSGERPPVNVPDAGGATGGGGGSIG